VSCALDKFIKVDSEPDRGALCFNIATHHLLAIHALHYAKIKNKLVVTRVGEQPPDRLKTRTNGRFKTSLGDQLMPQDTRFSLSPLKQ
jgi:hypothetical protein